MPPLVMKLVLTKAEASSPFFIRPIVGLVKNGIFSGYIDPNLKRIFAMINGYLERDGGRQWLAGGNEPTGADFMVRHGIFLNSMIVRNLIMNICRRRWNSRLKLVSMADVWSQAS